MWIWGIFWVIMCFCVFPPAISHAGFKICLMQEQKGAAAKFRPLLNYLVKKGMKASFVAAKTYPQAARMFAKGKVDGMFSGSGIAGCMIHAYPIDTGWSFAVCSKSCQITLGPFWNFSISSLMKLHVLVIWSVFDGLRGSNVHLVVNSVNRGVFKPDHVF